MFIQTKSGKHFTEIPCDEALNRVYGIMEELDKLGRVPAFTKQRDRYYLAVAIYNLFYRLSRPHFKRDQTYDRPYICLARGTQFYSGKYLEARPHLQDMIGKDKLTHRLAKRIARYLVRYGICYEEIGYPSTRVDIIETESGGIIHKWVVEPLKGQMTRLLLIPDNGWDLPDEVKAKVHDKVIGILLSLEEQDQFPAIHRNKYENEEGHTVVDTTEMAPVFVDLINRINSHMRNKLPFDYHYMMAYKCIAGKNLHEHMRLYAPLTSMAREAREMVFKKLGFVEHDISACAYNICYMMETGHMFESEEFGSDIYSDIIYTYFCNIFQPYGLRKPVSVPRGWVRPYSDEIHYMRPLIKKMLTISQGTSYAGEGQVVARITQLMIDSGFIADIRWARRQARAWRKDNPDCNRSKYMGVYEKYKKEAKKKKVEKWEEYKKENKLHPKARHPAHIDPRELFFFLFRNERYAPLAKYMFNGSFKISTNVETMANLMLHEYAIGRDIFFHSLHDAIYAKPEHMAELKMMQQYFLQQCCEMKREEQRIAEIWNPILKEIEEIGWKPKYFSFKAYKKDVASALAPIGFEAHARDIRGIFKLDHTRCELFMQKTVMDMRRQFDLLFRSINSSRGYSLSSLTSLLRSQIVSSFCASFPDSSFSYPFLKHYRTTLGEILDGEEHVPPILEPFIQGLNAEKDEVFDDFS